MNSLRTVLVLSACLFSGRSLPAVDQPNILWLSCEDISAHLGCYGYPNATTPNLDAFARKGVRYSHAFVTAGVCAPCRSAIITGMYQTSIGTQHMRCRARLPEHVQPFTHWLRTAGYYCTNQSKQDYQFTTPPGTWDVSSRKAHWKNRPEDKPFFAVFNYTGCHESGIASEAKYQAVTTGLKKHDRSVVAASLPPYYPDTPVVRDDWGRYYDVITAMDRWFAGHLKA
ncbi:MAG: sulfatase-like hydrolase/transferase, partial [Planctomycetaceae bacterium]